MPATDRTALTWTSAQVLSDVRRKASLPATSTDFTDAVLLREATDVLWSFAGWAVAQAGEGRMGAMLDRPLATALLGSGYRASGEVQLPPLAIADTIEGVTYVDNTGNAESRLGRIDVSQQPDYDRPDSTGTPIGYAILGSRIRLYPRPVTGGTVRITYQRRHPELVVDAAAAVGTVSYADPLSGNIRLTMGVVPTGLAVGEEIDLVRPTYPYVGVLASVPVIAVNGSQVDIEASPTLVSTSTLGTLRATRAGQTPYVHLPLELRAAFTEKVTANVMRIVGDLQGAAAAEEAAMKELSRVMQMLSPRTKRDRAKAVNNYSHLRMKMTRWRW